MLRRLSLYQMISARSKIVPNRTIYSQLLNKTADGCIEKLSNDRKNGETKEQYAIRSWQELSTLLKPDRFYIYVDKAKLKSGILYSGHIACFFTEQKTPFTIPNAFISLRNGDKIPGLTLQGSLTHDNTNTMRKHPIYKVKFHDHKEEIETYFFDKADDSIPHEKGNHRFLINIPRNFILKDLAEVPQFIKRLNAMKQKFCTSENYILINGIMSDGELSDFVESFNCVNGFYGALEIKGKMPNPSPQMAAWSFLKLVLGEIKRDQLISNSGLRDPSTGERCHDDDLEKSITPKFVK